MEQQQEELLEHVILGEIEGKNKAIHAYDQMMWKIRTGFLALLFGGWSILLKGIIGASKTTPPAQFRNLIIGLFIFSAGFSFGAWHIDRGYLRRKFRVILALNSLIDQIRNCHGDYYRISPELLKVAGDSGEMPYECQGYQQAKRIELSVYVVPLLCLIPAAYLWIRW